MRLPGRQEELLEALLTAGTPVVLVLLVGQPYDISRQSDRLEQKLYRAIVEGLGQHGVRPEDVLVSVVENGFEDWYAGRF